MHLTSEKDKMTAQINTFILAWSSNIFCSQSSNSLFKSSKGQLPAMQSKQNKEMHEKSLVLLLLPAYMIFWGFLN